METNSDYDFTEILYDGVYHNSTGPAIVYPNGTEYWYCHGQLHRLTGPAVTMPNGSEFWYKFGKLHRMEGPAMIFITDKKIRTLAWYIEGIRYTDPKKFQKAARLTTEQLLFLYERYGRLM